MTVGVSSFDSDPQVRSHGSAKAASWAIFVLGTLCACGWIHAQEPAAVAPAKPDIEQLYRDQAVPFLKKYCLDCHGPAKQESDVAFHKYQSAESVAADGKTWQTVLEMLRSGAMPPDDKPQPSPEEREQFIKWTEATIYHIDCNGPPDPGRVTIRRLNRAEYNNTVRDLLGIDFRPADDFPSDDVGSGFDNIGDVLSLPPLLMEKYLSAAETIAERTIVTQAMSQTQRREGDALQGEGAAQITGDGAWGINSVGLVKGEFEIPRDGEYQIRAIAGGDQAGKEPVEMELRLDDKKVKTFAVSVSRRKMRNYEIKTRLSQGKHLLSAVFTNDFYDPKNPDPKQRDRNLHVQALEIVGPLDVKLDEFPAAHRQLILEIPGDNTPLAAAARTNLKPLLSRAFRRKVTEEEVTRFVGLVEKSVSQGDTFEQGMQVALTGVLVSPHFLFRVERDTNPDDSAAQHELADYELASRLSYFLWSSLPDNELFADATNGDLRKDQVLDAHIRRMLQDPRSDALVQNFAMQWLNLRLLDAVSPDPKVFPEFSNELKGDMKRETELFVREIIHEDQSILKFLDGDFTYVNERLAKHYGILSIFGSDFQRVTFKDGRRAGVLTQASVLTLTSNPGRTSPVKRGKWILENILGSPPPNPPPDVPNLEATQKASPQASLRQQLELHRQNAVCASCHKTMDALGFGLENFDATGRWREKDGEFPIDASAALPGGDKFTGPAELVSVLKKRQREFARCLTEKLLTYALGRGLVFYDRCAVDKIVEAVEKDNYRFSTLVVEIAHSDPFRKRRGDGGKP